MRWLFRPSMLVLLSVVLAAGAAMLVLWSPPQEIRAAPLHDNESEIVWLYPATNESAWERFVSAVSRAAEQLAAAHPELRVSIDDNTFPRHTTAHPELAVTVRGGSQRLLFRWYKLTSDQKTNQWVAALLDGSRRPPLAIIGGNSSDQAKEIALSLKDQVTRRGLATAPLLLLTTATAENVQVGDLSDYLPLQDLYAGRTFRFCFTNPQMASAVTRFVAARNELRPDLGPPYVAMWQDDAYSKDLTDRFCTVLQGPALLALGASTVGLLGSPHGPGPLLAASALFPGRAPVPVSETIDYSVGGFDQPNRWEAPAVERLMKTKIEQFPEQKRPLLVLAAPSSQPARRVLRGLVRTAPAEARRFVVVTGDALSFNTVYRDRNVLWPVQDLPFELVFFCHRNPVDEAAGFLREDAHPAGTTAPATGTEDLLLYADIVEALVQAVGQGEAMPADGDALGARLRQARWHDGRVSFGDDGPALFDAEGNRRDGTGEHIVWLRPAVQGQRVLPQAAIAVYDWQGPAAGGPWHLVRRLEVDYDETGADR